MKKNEIIIIFAIIGTLVIIATSIPLIEVFQILEQLIQRARR